MEGWTELVHVVGNICSACLPYLAATSHFAMTHLVAVICLYGDLYARTIWQATSHLVGSICSSLPYTLLL